MHRTHPILPIVRATVIYTVLTVVMTWPLVLHMGNSLVGYLGDNIYFVWMIGWFKKALFDLGVNPFDIWFLNYPQGWNLAYTEITPLQLAIAMPFSFIGGEVFAYNASMMFSFITAGLTMYLWVRKVTREESAALLAGFLFAFLPYHMAHFLIGHLNLAGIQWFPLFFWGLLDLLKNTRKESIDDHHGKWWKPALLAGIALGLIALTSMYFLYMTLLISACMVIFYALVFDKKYLFRLDSWKRLIGMGMISLPMVLAASLPYLSLSQAGGLPDRDLEVVRRFSAAASPTDFILPSTDHFLWGQWILQHFNRELWAECTLYIGALSLVLCGLAIFRRKKTQIYPLGWVLACGAAVSFLLALGIDLLWFNERVTVSVPAFLASLINRNEAHIPMAGYFLFKFLPFYAKLRAFARFGVFLLIFSCFSAGIGAAWLLKKVNMRWKTSLSLLLFGLAFLDFYPGAYSQFSLVQARAVDVWLAEQSGQGALIQMPFIQGEDQEQIYYTLIHGKPFVGGFFNAFPPEQYQRIFPVMENFPDKASVELMRQLRVQYVLVDVDEYGDVTVVKSRCEELGLHYVQQLDDQMIFTLSVEQE